LYVSLKNSSGTDDQIISASADVCQELELHQTVLTGDVSSMPAVEADAMSISAGETLLMEPNGLHLMCLGLPAPLVEGEELTLTLTLAQAGDIEVIVKVQQR
jgi:copper(I)-binding protein